MKPPSRSDPQPSADAGEGEVSLLAGVRWVSPVTSGFEARFLRYAWLPIPLIAVAILGLWLWGPTRVAEPPYLVAILSFVFRTAVGVFIAYLAARSFRRNGSLSVLLLGCGMLIYGLSSLFSGLAAHYQQINVAVTVHNTGMCFAAVCHVLTVLVVFGKDDRVIRHARLVATSAYTLVLLIVGALAYAAMVGATPVFIDPEEGATPLRQTMLGAAVGMFAFATAVVGSIAHRLHAPRAGRPDARGAAPLGGCHARA